MANLLPDPMGPHKSTVNVTIPQRTPLTGRRYTASAGVDNTRAPGGGGPPGGGGGTAARKTSKQPNLQRPLIWAVATPGVILMQ